jgi:hypothetical protein
VGGGVCATGFAQFECMEDRRSVVVRMLVRLLEVCWRGGRSQPAACIDLYLFNSCAFPTGCLRVLSMAVLPACLPA